MRRIIGVALLLLSAACASFNRSTGRFPLRGAEFCATNPDSTGGKKIVVAQDGMSRTIAVGERVAPGDTTCFRWPFIDYKGRLGLVSGRDTTWGSWFEPWGQVRNNPYQEKDS